jgi:hypothetical protein
MQDKSLNPEANQDEVEKFNGYVEHKNADEHLLNENLQTPIAHLGSRFLCQRLESLGHRQLLSFSGLIIICNFCD